MKKILALPWVVDGLEEAEIATINALQYLSGIAQEITYSLVDMPFLSTIERTDGEAIWSIYWLFEGNQSLAEYILSHPALEGGIADPHIYIILSLKSEMSRSLIDKLLAPHTTESRTVVLPLRGEIPLLIIRYDPGSRRALDLLEYTVTFNEDLHGEPFPRDRAVVLFSAELAEYYNSGARNFGSHIVSGVWYDVDDESALSAELGGLLGHEVAHYYWRVGPPWIVEGMANTLGAISEHLRVGDPLFGEPSRLEGCGNMARLEALDSEMSWRPGQKEQTCVVTLGEFMFLELYLELGPEVFSEGLRLFYLASQLGEKRSIFEVIEAFGAEDEAVREIVDYWYSGEAVPR